MGDVTIVDTTSLGPCPKCGTERIRIRTSHHDPPLVVRVETREVCGCGVTLHTPNDSA